MAEPLRLAVGIVGVKFGRDVTVVEPVNLYGCEIGDESFIGPFVEIQKNAKIGNRCRVQSHSLICELVTVGDDCFIGHGVMFINDDFRSGRPAGGDRDRWRPTRVGNRVSIGTNATVLPVTIGDDVVVGAGSVVSTDLEQPGIYAGNPARFLRSVDSG